MLEDAVLCAGLEKRGGSGSGIEDGFHRWRSGITVGSITCLNSCFGGMLAMKASMV